MRRGLPWIVLLIALVAASIALQRNAREGETGNTATGRAALPASTSNPAPDILDGAFPDDRPGSRQPAWPQDPSLPDPGTAGSSDLPPEAHATLRRILADGSFPYRQDGGTFGNRERLLPARARSWYREYTVETPGSRDRGARRIVAGGDPPSEFFYTDDHYRSFRRIDAQGRAR